VLVGVLFIGYAIGRSAAPSADQAVTSTPPAPFGHIHGDGAPDANALVGGLSVSDHGLTLVPSTTRFTAGVTQPFTFRIVGYDGQPVLKYEVQHEKPLHLVVIRSDLSGYQHLHPTLAEDGTWSVPLRWPAAGVWRAYADFVTTTASGRLVATTLGVNLTVTGDDRSTTLPEPANGSSVDGYRVTLDGTPRVNVFTPMMLRVSHGGQPAELERYLGAYGHLVIVREADLGYIHVHPDGDLVDGAVRCSIATPSPGRYRAYFDFQVGGQVRTAQFTLVVT
jgi:hypothetical protein